MERVLRLDTATVLKALTCGLHVAHGRGIHGNVVEETFELMFVRQGCLYIREENREFAVEAGQTLLLWPGRRHAGTRPYGKDLQFYWAHFFPPEPASAKGPTQVLKVPQLATPRRPDRLAETYQRFINDEHEGRLHPMAAGALMIEMLCDVADSSRLDPDIHTSTVALAARAKKLVDQRFREPLSTSTIAGLLRCNPDYLGRVFRSAYGSTLVGYLHRCRVQEARRRLASGEWNVEEVASECGFGTVGHFRNVFRRHTGMSPGAFKRLYTSL